MIRTEQVEKLVALARQHDTSAPGSAARAELQATLTKEFRASTRPEINAAIGRL
ncbi:hypothetical protein ACIBHY_53990 [Nonomuraea sp. NPDC050547]|uniref:hypothetical protein n=1 Tax=Nonomuraea sp. NPDC050547 TaxID=3364368 RepID=UPI00378B7F8D